MGEETKSLTWYVAYGSKTAATLRVIAECGRAEGEHGSKHKPVDALASIGGASGFADSSPLQRMWRDANVALRHGLVNTDPGLEDLRSCVAGP